MASKPCTNIPQNPHFTHIERAPYELGRLLLELPKNFSERSAATPDDLLVTEAATQHAINANATILHGLEALGHFLFSAATNEDGGVEVDQFAPLGCLITHVAVESQSLQETAASLTYAVREHGKVQP